MSPHELLIKLYVYIFYQGYEKLLKNFGNFVCLGVYNHKMIFSKIFNKTLLGNMCCRKISFSTYRINS